MEDVAADGMEEAAAAGMENPATIGTRLPQDLSLDDAKVDAASRGFASSRRAW
jgi:hypothetical protein